MSQQTTDETASLRPAVEAVLFATGRAVSAEELARACGTDTETMRREMTGMAEEWNASDRGTEIIELDDAWQMCTRKDYYPQLITLELHPRQPRMTDVLLETLSVIAYRQPVTKAEIERIRGVNSDHAVNRLVEFHLVEELGRAKQPGRPILFGTTREFLRIFGMSSPETLPEISPVKLEDFREEAEEEADGRNLEAAPEEAQEKGTDELPRTSYEDGEITVDI